MNDSGDPIRDRLLSFQPISNRFLRWLLNWSPWILTFLLLADWLIGARTFTADTFRLPAMLAAILELILFNVMLTRIPDRLVELNDQGVIQGDSARGVFLQWLDRFEKDLNDRKAWVAGLALGLAALSFTYPVVYWMKTGTSNLSTTQILVYYTWGNGGLAAPILGYFLGLLAWRAGATAYNIHRLGRDVELRVLPEHPDRCGGLRSTGDICLQLALLVLIPAIFLSFFGVALGFIQIPGTISIFSLFGDSARRWLLVLIAAGFFVFFQPLYAIHRRMEQGRLNVQRELAELSLRMEQVASELRNQADTITPAQGKERLDQLEFMEKVYQRSRRFPTWPFDAKQLAGFISAQVIPLLSLLGASEPLTKGLFILLGWIQ